MKKMTALLLVAIVTFGLVACGEKKVAGQETKDRAGNAIVLPEEVNSIVSLAASTTQILNDLGLSDKLVAVDSYSAFLLGDSATQDLVILDMTQPDLEQLTKLKPDIIFVSNISSGGGQDIMMPLRDSGVCVAEIPTPETVQGTLEDVQFIADSTNTTEKGKALVAEATATLEKIAKALKEEKREAPRVYFEVAPAPNLYSTGNSTYLNELITLAGGKNIFADNDGWIAVTEESVLLADPEYIFTAVDFIEDATDEIKSRAGWENVSAISSEQVHFIAPEISQQPTHHIVEAIWEMHTQMYPEQQEIPENTKEESQSISAESTSAAA